MSVKTIAATDVGVNPEAISDNALKVVRTLQDAGYQAYLVGGCVRDLILGRRPKDFDVSTDATPEQIKKLFRNSRIIGRRFRLVHVRFGYEVIEVATFRADANDRDSVSSQEMKEGDQGQLLRDNVYGSIEEDVQRRDFRANALYYDPEQNRILDFVGGIDDIQHQKLISIGDPKLRFREDPVRMLRVIRFAAKLGFSMEPEAMEMVEQEGKLLAHVSSARLFEEVLKLFHGGAAYDTYVMLREYGLFKYLFPFTDQSVLDDVEGMPERALKNTDKRILAGKPVIPAFLFACMLWDPVRADAQILMYDGTPEAQAWKIAMADALRDQNQYVAVPRRLAEIILDIWNIHFRLVKRNPRMVRGSLSNRRFRAAYDFLLLRVTLHEVEEEIGEWWTEIQEVESDEQDEMISELGKHYKEQRVTQHSDGETNGNSVNYTPPKNETKPRGRNQKNQRNQRNQSNQKNRDGQGRVTKKRRSKKAAGGQRRRQGASQGGQAAQGNQSRGNQAQGNNASPGNGGAPTAKSRRKKRTGGRNSQRPGQQRSGGGQRSRASSDRFAAEARPKDDYGNHQLASSGDEARTKKVKVRHKRRVPQPDGDDTPHF